jgi:hypothetical protein
MATIAEGEIRMTKPVKFYEEVRQERSSQGWRQWNLLRPLVSTPRCTTSLKTEKSPSATHSSRGLKSRWRRRSMQSQAQKRESSARQRKSRVSSFVAGLEQLKFYVRLDQRGRSVKSKTAAREAADSIFHPVKGERK